MSVGYFNEEVVPTKALKAEDSLEILQYLQSNALSGNSRKRDSICGGRFSCIPREPLEIVFRRGMPLYPPSPNWVYRNRPDALSFKTNLDVLLDGIGIYYGTKSWAKAFVYKNEKEELIATSKVKDFSFLGIASGVEKDREDWMMESEGKLMFEESILIRKCETYTIKLFQGGDSTKSLIQCSHLLEKNGLKIVFENASNGISQNGTNVNKGQFPFFIFTLFEKP